MKFFLLSCTLVALSIACANGSAIGHFTCENGGAGMDSLMESMLTVKCPMSTDALDGLDPAAFENGITEDQMMDLMGAMMACHYKCIMQGPLKAMNDKGKMVPAKANAYSKAFPKKHQKTVEGKVSACVKTHNPKIKKESGKNCKTWKGFSGCMMEVLSMDPC